MKSYKLIANFMDGSKYSRCIRNSRDLSIFNKTLMNSKTEILSIVRIGD